MTPLKPLASPFDTTPLKPSARALVLTSYYFGHILQNHEFKWSGAIHQSSLSAKSKMSNYTTQILEEDTKNKI